MKRIYLFILLICSFASAQDTLYYDIDWKESLPEAAAYYVVEERPSTGEIDLLKRTYLINGQIESERSFKKKGEKLTPEGPHKDWYPNGQLWYKGSYRKGERHGELLAYWEDGSIRRNETYRKGKLKSGRVWNREGEEIEYFPLMIPASFPGGQPAISAYLRNTLPVPEHQKVNTLVKVKVRIRINKEGELDKIKVIEGTPHWYNAATVNTLTKMPKWNPGKFMGDPVNVWFTLPVTFRK